MKKHCLCWRSFLFPRPSIFELQRLSSDFCRSQSPSFEPAGSRQCAADFVGRLAQTCQNWILTFSQRPAVSSRSIAFEFEHQFLPDFQSDLMIGVRLRECSWRRSQATVDETGHQSNEEKL